MTERQQPGKNGVGEWGRQRACILRPPTPRCLPKDGFTLLELLLALSLTAMLAGVLYTSMYVAFKSRDTAMAAMDPAQRAAGAFTLMAQDFDGALPPTGTLVADFTGTAQARSSSAATPTPMGAQSSGLSASSSKLNSSSSGSLHVDSNDASAILLLSFYAASNSPRPEEFGADIRKIEFSIETPDVGTTAKASPTAVRKPALVRRVYYNLLPSKTPEPRVQILCRNVRSCLFRYWDGTVWRDDWDSKAQGDIIPMAVEATLELEGKKPEDPTYKLARVFSLTCGASATQAAAGTGGN